MIPRKTIQLAAAFLAVMPFLFCATPGASGQIPHNDEFVHHSGDELTLGGQQFRYGGVNIEWLGLMNYGVYDPTGTRYPSRLEIDDALDTAKAMGASVIRSQTLGDSVGCGLCIEPKPGEFNPEAFRRIDYVVKAAHDRGLRLVFTLIGDCDEWCDMSGASMYFKNRGPAGSKDFFTDPAIITQFERHINELLNHTNSLTGIKYKDDPTILAWENCNMCGLVVKFLAPDQPTSAFVSWVDTIGSYVKSIDTKHLYQDDSGFFLLDKSGAALDTKTTDIITSEYYPHWDKVFDLGEKTTPQTFSKHAVAVTAKGKVYIVDEFGWDNTNWSTRDDLQTVLKAIESDPKISGDLYWALQAHADSFGWQPIPNNVPNLAYAKMGETGQWWALYYGGINTLINSKEDMAARAEMLRAHAYRMNGQTVPPHAIPPAPVITIKMLGVLAWHGSAGAVKYSIERKDGDASPWKTICDMCAGDDDTPWVDPKPAQNAFGARYRVTAYNADGNSSGPSAER